MPFFLKPCLKLRKKKKSSKINSSMYFKSYLDKESPITSEATETSASNSFASFELKENCCSFEKKLEISKSLKENAEVGKIEESQDETHSSEKDILDILDSAVEQLSDERSTSDEENRYCIMSSESKFGEENEDIQLRRLLTQSTNNLEEMVDVANKQLFLNNCEQEKNESLIMVSELIEDSKTSENSYLKVVPVGMKDILKEMDGRIINIIEQKPMKECTANIIDLVRLPQQVTELKCPEPTVINECSVKNNLDSCLYKPIVQNYYSCDESRVAAPENTELSGNHIGSKSEFSEQKYFKSKPTMDSENISNMLISDEMSEPNTDQNLNNNQFFDSELSAALSKSLGITCVTFNFGPSVKNMAEQFSRDSVENHSDSNRLEETSIQNKEKNIIIDPKSNIKHTVGDNTADSLKQNVRNDNIKKNIDVLIQNDSNIKNEQSDTLSVECSGDHITSVLDLPDKRITCRMAENLAQNQMLNPATDFVHANTDRRSRAKDKKPNTIGKRRRSRNVLLNSLNIKLSPDDVRNEVDTAKQQNLQDNLNEKHDKNLYETNEIHSPMLDINSKDSMTQQIVGYALLYEGETLKTEETELNSAFRNEISISKSEINEKEAIDTKKTEKCLNISQLFSRNNLCQDDVQNKTSTQTLDESLCETRNNFCLKKNIEPSTQLTNDVKLKLGEMIRKLIKFAQVELTQYNPLSSGDTYSLKTFVEELLFDYIFYQDRSDGGCIENVERLGSESLIRNRTYSKEICGSDITKEIENKFYRKVIHPTMFTEENYRNSNYDKIENDFGHNKTVHIESRVPSENSLNKSSWTGANCYGREQEVKEQNLQMNSFTTNFNDGWNIDSKENVVQETMLQTLDECLAMEEFLKSKIKKQRLQENALNICNDLETEISYDTIESPEPFFTNEDQMCYKVMLHNDISVVPALIDPKFFVFHELGSFVRFENGKIFGSPTSSEGGDIGEEGNEPYKSPKNSLTETSVPCGGICFEEHDDNDIDIPDKIPFSTFTKQNAEKSNLKRQDIQNGLTFILSPRRDDSQVKCNMTISKDKAGNPSYIIPPLSVQVTRKNIERKERDFKEAIPKSSVEELLETYRRHRLYVNEMQKIEEERLRNLEMYTRYKKEALKPMKYHTRAVPIQSTESMEFTLSDDTEKLSKKRLSKAKKSSAHVDISPRRTRQHKFSSPSTVLTSYPSSLGSSVHDLEIREVKSPLRKQTSRKKDNYMLSPDCHLYGTPLRKRILSASKAIRSPKYPLRIGQSTSKEMLGHKGSPHKIIVKRPKVYFVRRSPSGNIQHEKGAPCTSENSRSMEDYKRYLSSPYNDYKKHIRTDEMHSTFDAKFRRYAKKGRKTGDLISYRRSTEWLRDAGIVGRTMTAEEADRAFKTAAG
ncbi:uncharacterized protein NPIL_597071 [Nephila pilipes]|uniref:Uncharacterized protein n=1 Tax=Nephila pilipes TaxID=299642 RepID=A0A8X6PUS7_NEPPI|nr:uncharacterized protein NPIL_597071 [Nephila pilipes]